MCAFIIKNNIFIFIIMDNSNTLTNSIFQSSESSIPTASTNSSISNTSGESDVGFFGFLKSINLTTWLLILLIFAFLGFNIFVYLAKGTQDITNFFAPILQKVFGITIATTGKVVDVSAEGAKAVVSGTANVIDKGLTDVQNIIPTGSSSSLSSQSVQSTIPQSNSMENTSLNRALNTSKQSQQSQQGTNNEYEANEASSSINSTGKAGWCYIGEDRGFRSCAQVGVNDQCMSGDIFPTNEICINPSLRP
jgi:hypothetical protein